jgi:hypothetical protein
VDDKHPASDSPVFIMSAGWRSGSTMLQRLLTSSGQILVWGESGGALNCLEDMHARYQQMLGSGAHLFRHGYGGNGDRQWMEFVENPHTESRAHNWIASMNPPLEEINGAVRGLFEAYYARPAKNMGYQRWGVKEVQCGIITATYIREIYPLAKFVFLVRNPMDCLLSIKRRNWMDYKEPAQAVRYYAETWRKLASDFRTASFGRYIKYEDLVGNDSVLRELENYLEVGGLSRKFVEESRADWVPENQEGLTWRERRAILKILSPEMKAHGYRARNDD